jgi:hypothetical protein
MKLFARMWPRLLAASAVGVLLAACASQGEGDRCDLKNFDNDCDTSIGLKCTTMAVGGVTYGVCCLAGNPNSVAACVPQTGTMTPNTASDASTAGDAAAETSTDSGAAE